MAAIDYDALESWAIAAAQELQEICDDAQAAAGDPEGTDQLPGVRQLLADLNAIIQPAWLELIADASAPGLESL